MEEKPDYSVYRPLTEESLQEALKMIIKESNKPRVYVYPPFFKNKEFDKILKEVWEERMKSSGLK